MVSLSSLVELVQARWRLIVLVLAGIALLGYVFFGRSSANGPTLTVHEGTFITQVSVSGTVTAAQDSNLGFAANGRIRGVYASVGEHVEAGTILAETENGDLVAALSQAKANLASLQAGSRPEQVAVAEAAVESAAAALVNAMQSAYTASDDAVHNKVDAFFSNARTNPKLSFAVSNAILQTTVERDRSQVESILASWGRIVAGLTPLTVAGHVADAQAYLTQVGILLSDANAALNQASPDTITTLTVLSTYTTNVATARTTVNTAATALSSAVAALDTAVKNLTLTQAGPTIDALAAQQALVQSAQSALAKTRVVAPFSGIVTRMDAKVGEVVSPSTSEISLQSDGIFQIETFVPEVAIAQIQVGNAATVVLDAYGSTVSFPAKVVAVDPAETVKDGVPTYKTILSFLTRDTRIRSGMTANVRIDTGTLERAIVIPSGAVGRDGTRTYVSVRLGDTTEKRTVTLGPAPALGQAHILSGVSEGEVILLAPAP